MVHCHRFLLVQFAVLSKNDREFAIITLTLLLLLKQRYVHSHAFRSTLVRET